MPSAPRSGPADGAACAVPALPHHHAVTPTCTTTGTDPAGTTPPDPSVPLSAWDEGWAAALDAALRTRRVQGPWQPGRVSRADRRACDVLVDGRGDPVGAPWTPWLTRRTDTDPTAAPVAGDWVLLTTPPGSGRPMVSAVLERRSAVVRAQAAAGSSSTQVLAANADVAAVVEGMVPDLDPARVERLLALAWSSGARPMVLLTKADLVPDPRGIAAEVRHLAPGVEVLTTAATLDEGLDPLRALLRHGATIALLGASGVGKSTLLNALVVGPDRPGPMATRPLGAENTGRHTTVTRELHLTPEGGAVLDTPGLRTIGLAGGTSVDDVFPEIEALAAGCRFTDCEHRTEPGCAVLAAVEAGDLAPRRLESLRRLERERVHQAARTDRRLAAEERARWRAVARSQRRGPGRR